MTEGKLTIKDLSICLIVISLAIFASDIMGASGFIKHILMILMIMGSVLVFVNVNADKEKAVEDDEKLNKANLDLSERIEELKSLVARMYNIDKEFDYVGDVFEDIAQNIPKVSNGVTKCTSDINEQTILVSNIKDMAENTSVVTDEVKVVTKNTSKSIKSGFEIVGVLDDMAAVIKDNSEGVYETMMDLQKMSQEIKSIVDMITDISQQTGMLSLNASIEAARHGAEGKGFAIVAEEVRKLSDQSKVAAEGIKNIIDALNDKTEDSVSAVEKLREVSASQNKYFEETFAVFEQLKTSISRLDSTVENVGNVVGDMSHVGEKAVSKINTISSIGKDISNDVEEIVSSVKSIDIDSRKKSVLRLVNDLDIIIRKLEEDVK